MPTYDYECSHCNYFFEVFQKITDKALEYCPKCNRKVKRLIGAGAGVIFKGPGFYATDYPKGNKPPAKTEKSDTCSKDKTAGCNGCQANK